MSRVDAVRKLLALGPLEAGLLLEIMGGDREQAQAAVNKLLGTHEIYVSLGVYQHNDAKRRAPRFDPSSTGRRSVAMAGFSGCHLALTGSWTRNV